MAMTTPWQGIRLPGGREVRRAVWGGHVINHRSCKHEAVEIRKTLPLFSHHSSRPHSPPRNLERSHLGDAVAHLRVQLGRAISVSPAHAG